MILCICAIICWIIIVFSLTFLQQQKTDKKLSQVSKRLLLCCFSFLVFFYFPHRNMFQNAEPLKIDLTSNEETASLKGILSKERSNTILETCNHLYISRSVLKTLFDRSNGAIAYIYFSGRYDNRAKNYIAVKSSNNPPIIKKNGIAYPDTHSCAYRPPSAWGQASGRPVPAPGAYYLPHRWEQRLRR